MRKLLIYAAVFLGGILVDSQVQAQVISDSELKINHSPITQPGAFIASLEPAQFEYNTEKFSKFKLPEGKQLGFVNVNPSAAWPGLVKKENKIYPAGKNATATATVSKVDLESLIPVMVAALQEQQKEIEALRKELDAIKKNR